MDDEHEQDLHDWHRRHQPPTNEVPVVVPLEVALVRTPDVAVSVVGAEVFTTGMELEVRMVLRPGAGLDLLPLHQGAHGRSAPERFGVEFADGRRASTLLDWRGTDDVGEPVLDQRGGGGGGTQWSQRYWICPVPPAGPLTVVYACPALGLDEVQAVVEATPLAEAVARVEQLWPWEPEQHHDPIPPTLPVLPEGSWFAADVERWTDG